MTVLRITSSESDLPPECIRPATCSQDAIQARCVTCGHGYPRAPRVRPPEPFIEDYKKSVEDLFERINRVIYYEGK